MTYLTGMVTTHDWILTCDSVPCDGFSIHMESMFALLMFWDISLIFIAWLLLSLVWDKHIQVKNAEKSDLKGLLSEIVKKKTEEGRAGEAISDSIKTFEQMKKFLDKLKEPPAPQTPPATSTK